MATTTTNYGLVKPALTDSPPDITVMNPNWDKIDEELEKAVKKDGDVMTGSLTVIDNFNVNKTYNDVEYKSYIRPINYSIGNNGDYSTGFIHYKGDANQAQLMFNKDGVMLRDNVNAKAYKLFGQHNTGDAPFLPLTGGTLTGTTKLKRTLNNIVVETDLFPPNYNIDGDYVAALHLMRDGASKALFAFNEHGVVLRDVEASKVHTLFGTHNKATGSYTGNGSTTNRTIVTNGVGKMCMVYNGSYCSIVMPGGAIVVNRSSKTISWLESETAYYLDGNLYITTTNAAFNTSSTTYYYQVI